MSGPVLLTIFNSEPGSGTKFRVIFKVLPLAVKPLAVIGTSAPLTKLAVTASAGLACAEIAIPRTAITERTIGFIWKFPSKKHRNLRGGLSQGQALCVKRSYPHAGSEFYFGPVATTASVRYISRLLPWNSALSLTLKFARSISSHRVNFQCVAPVCALAVETEVIKG